MTTRRTAAALVVALSAMCAACTTSTTSPQDTTPDATVPSQGLPPEGQAALGPWQPLPVPPGPTPTAKIPAGTPEIQLDEALATAESGRDRTAAEEACRDFIKLIADARVDAEPVDILDAIAADTLPDLERAYILQDLTLQRELQWEKRLDFSDGGWIRSTATGPDAQPSRVDVELAGRTVLETPEPLNSWDSTRCTTTWIQGQGWRLAGYLDGGSAGPLEATLPPEYLDDLLPGRGWRPLEQTS